MKEVKKRKRCISKLRDSATPPQFNLNKVSKSCFPFLTLLGEICTYIETNDNNNNNDIYTEGVSSGNNLNDNLFIDRDLYPFSHFLQNLIQKANLQRGRSDYGHQNRDETLILIMRSLEYPIYPNKCDIDNKYSFASRLKNYANKSEKNVAPENDNTNFSEIRFILQKLFPLEKNADNSNFMYSKKLKSLSASVKACESVKVRIPYSFLHNTLKDSVGSSALLHFSSLSSNFSGEKFECSYNEGNDSSEGMDYRKSVSNGKELFEALMNNVHLHSLVNHKNNIECKGDDAKVRSALDNKDNSGKTIVEKILLQHLHNKWEM